MRTTSLSIVLLAPFAVACGDFSSEEDGFSLAVAPPERSETETGVPGGWSPDQGDGAADEGPAPLVAAGTWEMQVVKAQGPACWSGIEDGQSATLQVESTETSVTFMDLVVTKALESGELVGSGTRVTRNGDGCERMETLYIEATLDDAHSMATYMELTIEHVGEACSESKSPLADCSTIWTADLWAQESKDGTTPKD